MEDCDEAIRPGPLVRALAGTAADLACPGRHATNGSSRPVRWRTPAGAWSRPGARTIAIAAPASPPVRPTPCTMGWPGSSCRLPERCTGLPRPRRDLSRRRPHAARDDGPAGHRRRGAADTRPWLDHGLWPPQAARCATTPPRRRHCRRRCCRPTTPSFASRATACTRSRSARCTPASSSRGTSASRSSARRCCGSSSTWATRTRASTAASRNCRRSTRTAWPAGSRATRRWPAPGPTAWRSNRPPAVSIPMRAQWLRALMLERERVANHLGDLGALGNDAALGFGLAQFSRLREDWQRLSLQAFGHRFMMDCVVPGGVERRPRRAHARSPAPAMRCDRARVARAARGL